MIPRGRETLDRIEGHELQDNEIPTLNMEIRVLAYTGRKWIGDPNPIQVQPEWHICTHENTWLRKVGWDPLQWTWCDPYARQGSKPIPFFHFMIRLGRHNLATQTARVLATTKIWRTYNVPHKIVTKFW